MTLTQADFNPLPSYEGRLVLTRLKRLRRRFQSTPLIRGETLSGGANRSGVEDFNPLPSYEGRLLVLCRLRGYADFNPLPSYEGRQVSTDTTFTFQDFNPLPSYEGRHGRGFFYLQKIKISIHSPHTRGDRSAWRVSRAFCHFNPLPSYEGRRLFAISQRAC